MSRAIIFVVTSALAIASVAACGSEERAARTADISQSAETTHFAVPEGWHARAYVIDAPGDVPVAWASNVPFKGRDGSQPDKSHPVATISTLPAHGIVIIAIGPRRYEGNADFPQISLPLKVSDGHFLADRYKTQPAPNVSFGYIDRRVGDDVLNVSYYLGTNEPTAEMRADANRVLATLSVE